MKRWNRLDEARTPDGKTLALFEHDGAYSLRVDGAELMSTRMHASEDKLAELVCAPLEAKRGARVLVGGLGFGFTLKAALAALGPDAEVVVAELVPAIVAWNQNRAYGLAAEALADPRTRLVVQGVETVITAPGSGFDGIMLDVDNGPEALVSDGNADLYREQGLRQARAALRPKGCLGVWSAAQDPAFARLMGKLGFRVETVRVRAHTTSGGKHTLFLGRL